MRAWVIWTLLTLLAWGIWAVLYKLVGDGVSDAQLQAISTLGVLPILALLLLMKGPAPTGNRRLGIALALGSGIVSCLGNVAFYNVLSRGAKLFERGRIVAVDAVQNRAEIALRDTVCDRPPAGNALQGQLVLRAWTVTRGGGTAVHQQRLNRAGEHFDGTGGQPTDELIQFFGLCTLRCYGFALGSVHHAKINDSGCLRPHKSVVWPVRRPIDVTTAADGS